MPSLPAGYTLRPADDDLVPELLSFDRLVFPSGLDDETAARMPYPVPVDRTLAVLAPDGSLAAMHGSYGFTLTVPGATVPCAGLTWVGVHPAHRRRGLLSAMIGAHLQRTAARHEPVSALFAAEAAIYGRFGYGSAADDVRIAAPRRAALRPVPGSAELTVRFGAPGAGDVERLDQVHRTAAAGRPGAVTRDSAVLREQRLLDLPGLRRGGEQLRVATVHDGEDRIRGYALLRRHEVWEPAGPRSTVVIREIVALDPAATHRLWSFLLDLDLTWRIDSPMLAVDDPVLQLLVDRRATTPQVSDNLWLRLVDLPAALTARTYRAPLDLVLEVADSLIEQNAGRWRLTVGPTGSARVASTSAAADLALDIRELGAAYLGGRGLRALADAGLVDERTSGAVDAATVAFMSPRAPLCDWVF
jgi:predicted acetyltransferase